MLPFRCSDLLGCVGFLRIFIKGLLGGVPDVQNTNRRHFLPLQYGEKDTV